MAPLQVVLGWNHRKYSKIFFFRATWHRCLKFVSDIVYKSITKFVHMKAPGSKMSLLKVILGLKPKIHRKALKIFFFRPSWLKYLKFCMYSRTSVARTLMTRYHGYFEFVLESLGKNPIAAEIIIFGII